MPFLLVNALSKNRLGAEKYSVALDVKSVGNHSVCSNGTWLNLMSSCISQASPTTKQEFFREEMFYF